MESLAEAPNGERPCHGGCSCYPTVGPAPQGCQPIVLFLQKLAMTVLPVEAQLQCAGYYACDLTACGPEPSEVSTF